MSEDEDSAIAERAASPPQSVIDQRTLEAYKVCGVFLWLLKIVNEELIGHD